MVLRISPSQAESCLGILDGLNAECETFTQKHDGSRRRPWEPGEDLLIEVDEEDAKQVLEALDDGDVEYDED